MPLKLWFLQKALNSLRALSPFALIKFSIASSQLTTMLLRAILSQAAPSICLLFCLHLCAIARTRSERLAMDASSAAQCGQKSCPKFRSCLA